jgi:hypothetical protein
MDRHSADFRAPKKFKGNGESIFFVTESNPVNSPTISPIGELSGAQRIALEVSTGEGETMFPDAGTGTATKPPTSKNGNAMAMSVL